MSSNRFQSLIRSRLDPEGVLPEVTFVLPDSKSDWQGEHTIWQQDRVGRIYGGYEEGRGRFFEDIRVNSRKQGVGKAAYLLAIEEAHEAGEAFCSTSGTLTDTGLSRWQKLINLGVVEVVQPFSQHEQSAGHGSFYYYRADLRIHPDLHT